MRPTTSNAAASPTAAATVGFHRWNSPVPYLFGGLALMLGLITLALVILACSYKNSSSDSSSTGAEEKPARPSHVLQPEMEPKIVVIMAGDENPTFLARPDADADLQIIPELSPTNTEEPQQTQLEVPRRSNRERRSAISMSNVEKPLRIYCDNKAAELYSKNDKSSSKSKHIDIKFLVVKERVQNHLMSIEYISTELMIADPLTKGLPPKVFKEHVARAGVVWLWPMAVATRMRIVVARKQSNSNNNPVPTFADDQRPTRSAEADLGPKVLVVMAGDNKPTFIATPASPSTTQNNQDIV
ncbi:hypothetical protein RHSIM_Rhsim08G0078900 [Rhododendron simsii]|uniref:Uncharacterized protein n=1 Tax=Rhododendron simsii TaxID=118357 RepID=A0A834LDE0_RHOSS|nr:hypothetical protein RHSIM_Rhsim08G0078900 [Rhododendron simsii]